MPSLQDLKVPYTLLQSGESRWGTASLLVSAALIALQSFARGMYLGGIKEWIQHRSIGSLTASGRRHFRSMLVWSYLQFVAFICLPYLTYVFFPLGLLLIAVMLFYSLTPYLIVLQNMDLGDALVKAPRMFRHYFGAMLPLALLSMLCTFGISLMKTMPSPLSYAVPLLLYAVVGTMLISAFMRKLIVKLQADGEPVPELPSSGGQTANNRYAAALNILLVPALIAAGVYTATGNQIRALDFRSKTSYDGINFRGSFSDVFIASSQSYSAYEWQDGDYRLSIRLPDLTSDNKPEELRGVADITWRVKEEVRTVSGNTTNIYVEPFWRSSKIIYRLKRYTSSDGSYYYSSRFGYASLLPGGEKPHEPLSVGLFVSGDGEHLFALQYSSRLDAPELYRVSEDGRYLVPGTGKLNPMDIQFYWFTAAHRTDNILDMLSAKNKQSYTQSLNGIYTVLAAAMQEGDGRTVALLLETMRRNNIHLEAPDWDAEEWTHYLRGLYEGATIQDMLRYLTKAGEQFGYSGMESAAESTEDWAAYEINVSFPNGTIPIKYGQSKADGKLVSLTIPIEEKMAT